MSGLAPLQATFSVEFDALTIAADGLYAIGSAPWAGTLVSATYAPNAAITGANTNSRTFNVLNGGAAGSGTTNMAALAMVSAVNMTVDHPTALTQNATPANLVCAAGDQIIFQSLHVGTGIVDPGGEVVVTLTRT